MFARLIAQTIWADGALNNEPPKYRPLKRVWLPVYDLIALVNGLTAWIFGSRLLDRIFGPFADVIGVTFSLVALTCLIGVIFPAWWRTEIVGKLLLVGMVFGYVVCILAFPSPEQIALKEAPSYFVAGMLVFGLPLACFRLDMLSREEFDRRVQLKVTEINHA